jgi:hypothetical protein
LLVKAREIGADAIIYEQQGEREPKEEAIMQVMEFICKTPKEHLK